jgi:hypothetical protein
MANYNKVSMVGKPKTRKLPNGRVVERIAMGMVMVGESVTFLPVVDDDSDMYLYQNVRPYTMDEVIEKFKGKLPPHLQGHHILCCCGSPASILHAGQYAGHLICKHLADFGKHMVSENVEDGKLILSKDSKLWLDDSTNIDFESQKVVRREWLK